jgi:hypothetical protein
MRYHTNTTVTPQTFVPLGGAVGGRVDKVVLQVSDRKQTTSLFHSRKLKQCRYDHRSLLEQIPTPESPGLQQYQSYHGFNLDLDVLLGTTTITIHPAYLANPNWYQDITSLLGVYGFTWNQKFEQLRFIDLACDVALPWSEFVTKLERHPRHVVTALQPKPSAFKTTRYYGSGDCTLKIYDKQKERFDNAGIEIDPTVRVEYSLRVPWLNRYGVESWRDMVAHNAAIWNELTTKVFRVTDKPHNGRNLHRKRWSVWDDIQRFGCPAMTLLGN